MQVQTDLTSQGDRTAAYPGEDNAQPNQVVAAAAGIWAFAGAPDSAAYRGVVCRASIAVGGEDRSGSSQRLLMDSVVAPYLRVLELARRIDKSGGCSPEKTLILQKTG